MTQDVCGRNRLKRKTGAAAPVFWVRRPAWPARVQRAASAPSASPVTRTMRHSGSTVAPIFS
ncbi:hypothetical protein BamMEX5DRAFT_1700 [Burkholderia ambifaria MEX-5]|uniref:Uncharacterized protein n=1 Tax=Burkholderia ambifaria MEX-5 TaxID=396597 RepID=B1T1N4_9BURK|nr:hypothetical protein BamMEX5DRAFT_1700 [Burkholderia ambifaria MEX-5]